jgi:hypothetical protein
MQPDETTPSAPGDPGEQAARLLQEGLSPVALPVCRRERLLRRVLDRTAGQAPLAPAADAKPSSD